MVDHPAYTTWRLEPGWLGFFRLLVVLVCLLKHFDDLDRKSYAGLGVDGRALTIYTCTRCRRIMEVH